MIILVVPVLSRLMKSIDKSKLTPIRKVYFRKNGTRVEQTFWVKPKSITEKKNMVDEWSREYTVKTSRNEAGGFVSKEMAVYCVAGFGQVVDWSPLDKHMHGAEYQVHTHISSETFSLRDVITAVQYRIKKISVIAQSKKYTLTINKFPEDIDKFADTIRSFYEKAGREVSSMDITVREKYRLLGRMYMMEIAKMLGGSYVEI